jgi:predicted AAA+ superfamily ATPase
LFDPRNELFHYNEKGRVIDFILDLEGKLFPFEVRYQSSISSSDSANIVSFARQEGTKAVLITRDQMTIKEHLLEIPASLFLTLI